MMDIQYDPYSRNYVVRLEVSPEMADQLAKDPEARKVLSDALQTVVLAAFPSGDVVKEVMDPTKVQTR